MDELRIGSLFSGIGGLELGLEVAGLGKTIWQVEQEPYALKVLAKHWPNAKRYTDVREVGKHNLEEVDILCGGFPCQDISLAGKGAGIEGERSGLWGEFIRIIREMEPRIVIVENVSAILRRGIDRVLRDLAEAGYDAEWSCFRASTLGAHHHRDRWFLVAYPCGAARESCAHTATTPKRQEGRTWLDVGASRIRLPMRETNKDVADPNSAQREGKRLPLRIQKEYADTVRSSTRSRPSAWLPEPRVGRVADGVPNAPHRLRCLGNAVSPVVGEYIGLKIKAMLEWEELK